MQGGVGSIPGWGAKIPHAVWHSQKNLKNKKTQSRAWTWGTWVSTGDTCVSYPRGGQRECTDSPLGAKDMWVERTARAEL